jgi:hypothetical protein
LCGVVGRVENDGRLRGEVPRASVVDENEDKTALYEDGRYVDEVILGTIESGVTVW